jgi:ABC-type molybdate transport system ATPase subunit
VGVENLIPGEADGDEVRTSGGCALRSSNGHNGKVTVCLRAEEVRLERGFEQNGEANALCGKITKVARRGVEYSFEVDVGVKLTGRLTRAELGALGLEPGQEVTVHIRPSAVHCVPRAE